MSRSYHVTRRAAIRAFAQGDTVPGEAASEKSGIKKEEKRERRVAALTARRKKNSAIVSGEKNLTKIVLAKRLNTEPEGAA